MKEHILAALREELERWEELLAGLSEERITAPQRPSTWSIKDNVAHLMAWQKRSIARMEAAQADREPVFPDWPTGLDPDSDENTQRTNDWIYETNRERAWPDVYGDWREGFLRFIKSAVPLSERDLLSDNHYPWMSPYPLAMVLIASYDHHQEHMDIVRGGLSKQDDEVERQ